MKWIVFYHDINAKTIKKLNIFNHYSFNRDVENDLKKYKDKDEFAQRLKSNLMYYFWSKAEYEVIITSWPPHIKTSELDRLNAEREETLKKYNREPYCLYVNTDVAEKVDIYDQVMNNWDIFLDYVWGSKGV